jgi:hypothetical protein
VVRVSDMLHFWERPLIELTIEPLRVGAVHTQTIVHIPCMGKGGNVKCKVIRVECGQCLTNRRVVHSRNAVKLWLLTLGRIGLQSYQCRQLTIDGG